MDPAANLPPSERGTDFIHESGWIPLEGETYEELLSWSGYVPNQFNRICTRHLKLEVTRNFLKDWLAARPSIPRLGHFGNRSRIEPDITYRRHKSNQGGVPKDIFLRKRAYVWQRPHFRPEQRYDTFLPEWKHFENPALKGKTFGDKAWFGKGGVEYVAFIGLRGDEPHRIQRVEERNDGTSGYEGEHVYMPLSDMAVTRDDVNAFWDRQEWDLTLPKTGGLSNCVFCFLKGLAHLQGIRERMKEEVETEVPGFGPLTDTPCDLAWWERIERDYGRDLIAEGRKVRGKATRIGFFGTDSFFYGDLSVEVELGELAETMLPCDCTE